MCECVLIPISPAHRTGSPLPKPRSSVAMPTHLLLTGSGSQLCPCPTPPTLGSYFSSVPTVCSHDLQRTRLLCRLPPNPAHVMIMETVRNQTLWAGAHCAPTQQQYCFGKREIILQGSLFKKQGKKSIVKALKYKAFPCFHNLSLSWLVMIFFICSLTSF